MSKKPTPQKQRKHTAEFKEEALKLAERVGVTEATEELDVYANQIYSWRTVLGSMRTLSEREPQQATEIARLKRQLAEQAEELEILKKGGHLLREASKIKRFEFMSVHRDFFIDGDGSCFRCIAKWVLSEV